VQSSDTEVDVQLDDTDSQAPGEVDTQLGDTEEVDAQLGDTDSQAPGDVDAQWGDNDSQKGGKVDAQPLLSIMFKFLVKLAVSTHMHKIKFIRNIYNVGHCTVNINFIFINIDLHRKKCEHLPSFPPLSESCEVSF